MELAQAYRRLGSEVTVIEAATALAGEDPELAAIVLESIRAEGVTIRERTRSCASSDVARLASRSMWKRPKGLRAIDGTTSAYCRRPHCQRRGARS